MKNKLLIFFLTIGSFSFAQNERLVFSYDNAGNQVLREFDLDAEMRPAPEPDYKKTSKAYPSPMDDELNLEWLVEEEGVDLVQVKTYDMQGRLIHHEYARDYKKDQIKLSFNGYPQGIYIVKFYYTDETEETLKVLKK
ncbi:MAG: T9SS type A sorting domain-containing protein [Flavobacteriaceae bacterium]|nr:T9SS type A sorting domain-containing protein [Flavobacteriaceae bacterium]